VPARKRSARSKGPDRRHHSAADTLDKVDPENIRRQVAVLAMMAYFVAELPDALPRLPPSKPREF